MKKPSIKLGIWSVAIVTHRSLMPCIPGDDLKKYLLKNGVSSVAYITHPLLLLEESQSLSSQFEYYQKLKIIKSVKAPNFRLPETLAYLKDLFLTIYWILKTNQVFDLYFGLNNINAFAGLILKLLGRAKRVVYYSIDLYPQRFNKKSINWLYHKLDKLCVRFCDETWNVSQYATEYRKTHSKQFTVPIGIWFKEMQRVDLSEVNQNKIVYVGHLKKFYGVDLAIKAIPEIKKKINNIKLEIIGGGEDLEKLQQLAKKLKIESSIIFYGWKDKKDAEKILANGAIGLAPFNTHLLNKKVNHNVAGLIKNGDPAKIKDYLALGLPVIMTNASFTAKVIEKANCAIIIEDTPNSLAKAVIKLLTDKKMQTNYRKNALSYIQQFDWNNIFSKNINRLLSNE